MNDAQLPNNEKNQQSDLPALCFSSWLRRTRHALLKEKGVNVPCGDCHACCTSSYFIHIRPEETQTINRIPRNLLFPAPLLPKGNVLMGYDQNGRCPMLIEGRCSIYEQRPLTCRQYDCRVFTVAGIAAGAADKALINERTRRWRFKYPTGRDRDQHLAVQAAAKFLLEHADCFSTGMVPKNPTQLAIMAIKVYDVFLRLNKESEENGFIFPDIAVIKAITAAYEKFEAKRDC